MTDDSERDAWLSQALRHAPDANADVPAALSDAILREARSAAARARAASVASPGAGRLHWLAAAWAWLGRPPAAAGFASVMVAALVGIMWWDRPLDDGAPQVTAPTPALASASAPTPTPAQAPAATAPPTRAETAPVAAADAQRSTDERKAQRPTPAVAAARPAATQSPAPPAASRSADRRDEEVRERAVSAALPAPRAPLADPLAARVPAPAAQPPAPAPTTVQSEARAPLAKTAAAAAAAADSADAADAVAASSRFSAAPLALRVPPGGSGPRATQTTAADAGGGPLAGLLAALSRQPQRWRWQRDGREPQPIAPALQRWLVQLDRETAARWAAVPQATAAPRQPSSELRLLFEGTPRATVWLAGNQVWAVTVGAADPTGSTVWMATLPPLAADSLKAALDEAAR